MKRRKFLQSSLLTASLGTAIPFKNEAAVTDHNTKKPMREFYELRVYTCSNPSQEKIILDYFQQAAIPALNRLGSKNIGVFTLLKPETPSRIFVLIPFRSVEDFVNMEEKLAKDAAYLQAGEAYINATAAAPAYDRIESSLLHAFTHHPEIVAPAKKDRIFELRRYESATEAAGKTKISVFNDAGEIDIFKRTGLTPVFFGETLIGTLRPNLTYMLTFSNMADHDKSWKTFGGDDGWKKIKAVPEYADAKIVSHITSLFLVPTDFSQI